MPLKTIPGLPDDQYNARWIARLMQRVRPGENGCIEVTGFHNADGYANAYHRKWGDFPHRVLMIILHGPIAEGLMVCHRCGNHGCVNPDHLYIGTMKENARDTVNHGRHLEANKTHCIHGHPFDEANTYVCKKGKRHCIECQRKAQRERYQRMTPEQRAIRNALNKQRRRERHEAYRT
jgi:hypothetical protein